MRFFSFFPVKILFLFIFPVFILCAGLIIKDKSMQGKPEEHGGLISGHEQSLVPDRAETIMKTLSAAYPDRIGPAEFRNGDWAFLIGDKWFYYAEGRILPEEIRSRTEEYRPLGFNSNYQLELPSWESTFEQREARTRSMEENQNRGNRQNQVRTARRSQYFFEALWNIKNFDEAWDQQAEIDFLGHEIKIHSGISHLMAAINKIILEEAQTNPAVRQWINSLGTVEGWNWRNVASSGNRSFHSYGIAIDILPKNLGGLATYWLWTSRHDPQWWNTPYSRRYHPPDEVIRTFESFGFIWGGKWLNFDTMHFEYRPEIFILSNIPIKTEV